MGLLDSTTQREYYQGNDYGNYQFTSLEDIINQFLVAYVGEDKIIPKVKRVDVAFHAQRAMQELSFDTFKSIKSQQIELPPSMVMPLPRDYVNYTKISWPDSAGVKHPLYPTKHTSNPFQIDQDSEGAYQFDDGLYEHILNTDFTETPLGDAWAKGSVYNIISSHLANLVGSPLAGNVNDFTGAGTGTITFEHRAVERVNDGAIVSGVSTLKQTIDVTGKDTLDISATGLAANTTNNQVGVLRVGVITTAPAVFGGYLKHDSLVFYNGPNVSPNIFDLVDDSDNPSYMEWTVAGDNTATKQLTGIDVSNVNSVDIVVISYHEFTAKLDVLEATNSVSNVSVMSALSGSETYETSLTNPIGNEKNSSTWNNYKSGTPSENQDDYQDDTYWPNNQKRYGLDPQHAQVNGSFYIDDRLGRIHFSSNMSGKTVILDYISDSLGTDGEMQVHKFAEEAMYRWILHAIAAGRIQTQQLVPRLKKEKIAAIRQAKLRLSNIKLEELTQILRGKSKHIKH